jgi:hypothetical protein
VYLNRAIANLVVSRSHVYAISELAHVHNTSAQQSFFFIIISTSLQGLWAGEDTTENQLKCTQMSDSAISSHNVEGGTEVTIAQFSVSSSIMILQLVESSADGTEPTNV